jgi:hypothetical protein
MASLKFQLGLSSIRNYSRLNYEYWYALAEFIDNSTQSYTNNSSVLDSEFKKFNEKLEIKIAYDRSRDFLSIRDNAMGMNLNELNSALQMGKPPENTSGRSEFGMGLKTAACWLGSEWSIRTKKLGESTELEVLVDVEKVADGDTDLHLVEREKPINDHYTIIEIKQMRSKIQGNTITKIKSYLSSMYRIDTGSGNLNLLWGDERLDYEADINFLKVRDEIIKRNFEFVLENGKKVYGWMGVLDSGSRAKAGLAVIRRGRLISGQPTAWRPQRLFGWQEHGSNDLVNQRLLGEIHLDNFQASHTKNSIIFQDNEEEEIEFKLFEMFADFKDIAKNQRFRKSGGPDEENISLGLAALAEDLSRPEFVDKVNITEVPSPEIVAAQNQPVIDATKDSEPAKTINIGDITVNIYVEGFSPNDPYYVPEYKADSNQLTVIINTKHPFFQNKLLGSESVSTYFMLCAYDAIAEWKCLSKVGEIDAKTVNSIKNEYMKISGIL